jgi:isopenicillin N synthase-like dioxygenase
LHVTSPLFEEDGLEPTALDVALRECGGCFLHLSSATALLDRVLAVGRSFFSLPHDEKAALAIERSAHFRGWSEMRNERDWREQLHLGRERPAAGERPVFQRLEGPNLWPDDKAWRDVVSSYMEVAARLGQFILGRISSALGVDGACFDRVGREGYLVTKLIGYHPQRAIGTDRVGVAAHVDFSWLTINLQDSAGLEIRSPEGTWASVDVRPGTVWVHIGELLEHATDGRYVATPHRVINRSESRTRVSVPVFVNPPLDAVVPVLTDLPTLGGRPEQDLCGQDSGEHVHRVLQPRIGRVPLHFGSAEWHRKGLGGWCYACHPGTMEAVA